MLTISPLDKKLVTNEAVIGHQIYQYKAPPYLTFFLEKNQTGTAQLDSPQLKIEIFKGRLTYSGSSSSSSSVLLPRSTC